MYGVTAQGGRGGCALELRVKLVVVACTIVLEDGRLATTDGIGDRSSGGGGTVSVVGSAVADNTT